MTRTGNILGVDFDRSTARVPTPGHRVPAAHAFSGRAGLSSLAQSGFALVLANVRYWSTVAQIVRVQLARWEHAARSIPDPALRALALGKLRDEHFNAQVAATLGTLAPRAQRAHVVEAIVAMQVLYDYIDVRSEQSAAGASPIDDGILFTALTDAVTLDIDDGRDVGTDRAQAYYGDRSDSADGDYLQADTARTDDAGYLQALVETVNSALTRLPAATAVTPVAQRAAARCAEAQLLNHQASRSGVDELRNWATGRAAGTGLSWQQFLAGATASVLGIHALIAMAADPAATRAQAEELDALYLSIGALTMLDSLVDQEEDIAAGQLGYVQYYDDPEELASGLATLARASVARARRVPNGAHHIVTLAGILAYYASAPAARSAFALPITAPVRRELRPLITPTLALMRSWRLAKRMRKWRVRDSGENGHSPKGVPA